MKHVTTWWLKEHNPDFMTSIIATRQRATRYVSYAIIISFFERTKIVFSLKDVLRLTRWRISSYKMINYWVPRLNDITSSKTFQETDRVIINYCNVVWPGSTLEYLGRCNWTSGNEVLSSRAPSPFSASAQFANGCSRVSMNNIRNIGLIEIVPVLSTHFHRHSEK